MSREIGLSILSRMGDMTYKELSDRTGIHANTIGGYVRHGVEPSARNLAAIAKALGCDVNDLLEHVDLRHVMPRGDQ